LLQLDGGGQGGSALTIGGTLTNSSTIGTVSIGNTGLTSADTVTVKGTGGLSNSGTIDIEGSASAQATLDVADAAAGFGTAGVESGTVFLENDALLEFKSGQITTVNGTLQLDGANARVADAGATSSNSALAGLTSISGNFSLQNGAKVTTTGNLTVNFGATLEVDVTDGSGGSRLTIGGSLTNNTESNVSIGNTGLTSADTLTVKGTGGVTNETFDGLGNIHIVGSLTTQATLNIANAAAGFGTAGVVNWNVTLENDALLEFQSGQITTLEDGTLALDGAKARVADASATGSNSALTGLTNISSNFYLENGAKVATTGNLSISGSVQLDGINSGGPGGSSLTIGGSLSNSGSVSIGNTGTTSADTLTVSGTGGLSNANTIDIEGNTTAQATLNVADAAAGFGTAGVERGTVFLENDALLEFKSGQITTVDGTLWLDGASSRVADSGKTGSNSALTGLTSVAGNFYLENGAKVATTGNLSVTAGTIEVDGNNTGGGSRLTIGGNLTNSSTSGNGVAVGWTGLTSADSLTVNGKAGLSNTGQIKIFGNVTTQATLNVANGAAGFGTEGVETGTVFLQNDALLEFNSGQITSVDGTLRLDGASSRVADAGETGSNSALTGLTSVSGAFYLQNGAKVATTGNLSTTGSATVELDGPNTGGIGGGGTSLTIGGTLTNGSTNGSGISIGNNLIGSADIVTVKGAGGLSNTGNINIQGSGGATAQLVVTNTATNSGSGTITIGDGDLTAAALKSDSGTIIIGTDGSPSGDLTATDVDITGGTLEGFGTVTGALHDTGGTVVGGNLNSTTGTLTVNGAYFQSGAGILQTDINTGSSGISVTGSLGTPEAAGSVNLAGGTLLIDGETSLVLGTLYR
jgi:hypothetical protein